MITFEKALTHILQNTPTLPVTKVPIEESIGRILQENVYSKIEMPPFHKSAMDGYAVIAEDTKGAPLRLKCIGLIQAGETFRKKMKHGECVKIMTGAPLPRDADSVVMIENIRRTHRYVEIMKGVKKGENVCVRGEDIKRGQKVLEKGTKICPSYVALLATVGKRFVKAIRKAEVAVLNTGDEIVPVGSRLRRNQIYNSNGPQLIALLRSDGIEPHFLGIAKDEPDELREAIEAGLKRDMFLISGGVSMGDYDLVPGILRTLGLKKVFHRVNIKPGKPLLFGRRKNTIVFGIPGNPVSNFLTYLIFIRPSLYKMMGYDSYEPNFQEGIVAEEFRQKLGRKHFVLVNVSKRGNDYYLAPVFSHGSADIFALSKANGFMVVDGDIAVVKKHSKVPFIIWEEKI